MPDAERQIWDHGNNVVVFERICREFGLSVDRTSPADREADCKLVNEWLRTIHAFELDLFAQLMVSASFEELDETIE